jgi:hypothetical protein
VEGAPLAALRAAQGVPAAEPTALVPQQLQLQQREAGAGRRAGQREARLQQPQQQALAAVAAGGWRRGGEHPEAAPAVAQPQGAASPASAASQVAQGAAAAAQPTQGLAERGLQAARAAAPPALRKALQQE